MDTELMSMLEQMVFLNDQDEEIPDEMWEYLYFLLFVKFSEHSGH